MSYNSGVIVLAISNHSPDYSLNCTPLSPITITITTTTNTNNNNNNNNNNHVIYVSMNLAQGSGFSN